MRPFTGRRRHTGFTGLEQEAAEPVFTPSWVCLFYFAYLKSEQMMPVLCKGQKAFLGMEGRKTVCFPTGELFAQWMLKLKIIRDHKRYISSSHLLMIWVMGFRRDKRDFLHNSGRAHGVTPEHAKWMHVVNSQHDCFSRKYLVFYKTNI